MSKQFLTHNSAHILRLSISCLSSSSMQSTTEQVSSIIRERPSIISCKQDIGLFHTLGNAGSFTSWNVQGMVGGSKAKHSASSSSPQSWPSIVWASVKTTTFGWPPQWPLIFIFYKWPSLRFKAVHDLLPKLWCNFWEGAQPEVLISSLMWVCGSYPHKSAYLCIKVLPSPSNQTVGFLSFGPTSSCSWYNLSNDS